MIDMSEAIYSPEFMGDITIQRTTGGHFVGAEYISKTIILTFKGVLISPDKSKEVVITERGDQATGSVNIYIAGEIFATRERADGSNISDIIIENYGTNYPIKYRITNIQNLMDKGGYCKAVGTRMEAI